MWLEKLKIEGKFQEKPQIRGYFYFETKKYTLMIVLI